MENYETSGTGLDLFGLGNDAAAQLARWAGIEGDDAPDPGVSFERASGGRVRLAKACELAFGEKGAFYTARGDLPPEIVVRRGLDTQGLVWALAHETGHYASHRLGYRLGDFEEAFASVTGRASLMPLFSLRRAWQRYVDPRQMFELWDHVPPSHVALRLGESRVVDTWIATSRSVRQRRSEHAADRRMVLGLADAALKRGKGNCVEARGYIATVLPDEPGTAVVIGPQECFGF